MAIKTIAGVQTQIIDSLVSEIFHEPFFVNEAGLPLKQYESGKKKIYYYKALPIKVVNHGLKYDYQDRNTFAREESTEVVDSITIPIHIDYQDYVGASLAGIQSLLVDAEVESLKSMQDEIDKTILFGNSKAGNAGMTNFSGINSSAAAGVWTTAGNFFADVNTALSTLRAARVLPPYSIVATPGIKNEILGGNLAAAGNYTNELEVFNRLYFQSTGKVGGNAIFDKIVWTDKLINGTLGTANQAFIVFKNNPMYVYIAQVDGIHRKLIPHERFEEDIDYALCWSGCFIPKRDDAVYLVHTGTTTTAY